MHDEQPEKKIGHEKHERKIDGLDLPISLPQGEPRRQTIDREDRDKGEISGQRKRRINQQIIQKDVDTQNRQSQCA